MTEPCAIPRAGSEETSVTARSNAQKKTYLVMRAQLGLPGFAVLDQLLQSGDSRSKVCDLRFKTILV